MRILTQDGSTVRPASFFDQFAKQAECSLGHPMAFVIAVGAIVLWAVSGPFFHYSDTWQLVINTATTIVTFLMVFLIQNSQNRDSAAIQLKLNELIRTREGAHNMLLNLEELSLSDIQELKAHYEKLASCARNSIKQGKADTDTPEVHLG
ncbi:MAG: low affinity iron permease family protein [Nitrospirae bacterium]|nr:MAG: low affinity iron permease family protein [Nitrospirota bacterium]